MEVFEYIFTPDDSEGRPADAPLIICAKTIEDAIQILFLRELAERGVAGTIRVRRWRCGGRWIAKRYVPDR
ncbi:MAG TPA: hypothetical protein VIV57_27530 [Anaeromyxobacter sp.]